MNLKWKLEGILRSNKKSLGWTLAMLITSSDNMCFCGQKSYSIPAGTQQAQNGFSSPRSSLMFLNLCRGRNKKWRSIQCSFLISSFRNSMKCFLMGPGKEYNICCETISSLLLRGFSII